METEFRNPDSEHYVGLRYVDSNQAGIWSQGVRFLRAGSCGFSWRRGRAVWRPVVWGWTLGVCGFFGSDNAWAQSAPSAVVSSQVVDSRLDEAQLADINRWIEQLSGDDFEARQEAQRQLERVVNFAVDPMLDAIDSAEDFETVWRLRDLLIKAAVDSSDSQVTTKIAARFSRHRGPFQRDLAQTGAALSGRVSELRNEIALQRLQERGASIVVSGSWNQGMVGRPFIGDIDVAPVLVDIKPLPKVDFLPEANEADPFDGAAPANEVDEDGLQPPGLGRGFLPEDELNVIEEDAQAEVERMQRMLQIIERLGAPLEHGPPAEPDHGPEIEQFAPGFDGDIPNEMGEGNPVEAESPKPVQREVFGEVREVDPADVPDAMMVPVLQRAIQIQILPQGGPIPAPQVIPGFREVPADMLPPAAIQVIPGGIVNPGVPIESAPYSNSQRGPHGNGFLPDLSKVSREVPAYDWLRGELHESVESFEQKFVAQAQVQNQPLNISGINRVAGPQFIVMQNGVLQAVDLSGQLPNNDQDQLSLPKYGPAFELVAAPSDSMSPSYSMTRWAVIDETWRGTDEDWQYIPQISDLVSLQINGIELTPAALEAISRCTKLSNVSINRCRGDYQQLIEALDGKTGLNVTATGTGRMGVYGGEQVDFDGCVVGQVMEGTPAARAGLLPGDRIERIDGEVTPTFTHLALYVALKQPGDRLRLQVRRGNQRTVVEIELEARL